MPTSREHPYNEFNDKCQNLEHELKLWTENFTKSVVGLLHSYQGFSIEWLRNFHYESNMVIKKKECEGRQV